MGLFSKKKDPATQVQSAKKELEANLANVHVRVAEVRAEEARVRMRYQNTLRLLDDQKRFLANATRDGRESDAAIYTQKVASLQASADALKSDCETAQKNLIEVQKLENDLRMQLNNLSAQMPAIGEALADDPDWYYAPGYGEPPAEPEEAPAEPAPEQPAEEAAAEAPAEETPAE
ncbi:MAG: hypothetical protein II930_03395 [Lachnospiraceae bacterium]|nr:hypothetical protein [Lachnospiraceae bacterium]